MSAETVVIESTRERRPPPGSGNELSLLMLGSTLLRWRRRIVVLGVLGGVIGLTIGLLTPRTYRSSAMFLPQGSEGSMSGIAAAASQLGFQVPSSGGGWGPPIYVRLLTSPELLAPLAHDTVQVVEEGGRRVAVMDLLEVEGSSPADREYMTVRALRRMIGAGEVKTLGAVVVSVVSPWPSVSLQLADRLVDGVNRFNLEQRQTQAAAERRFADSLARNAERDLRLSEDRLQSFLQRNRMIAAPDLQFERDRLQREVGLRQQMYTSLLESVESARIREVRDTPVISVIEHPRLPVRPEARRSVFKGLLGGVMGVTLGILLALAAQAFARARHAPTTEAQEFRALVDQATPRFLRRRPR